MRARGRRLLLSRAGFDVTLFERDDAALQEFHRLLGRRHAGALLRSEATEPVITRLGLRSLDLWDDELPHGPRSGTLVVAHRRDRTDFDRFAQRTTGHDLIDADRLAALEPQLEGQFDRALFYRARSITSSRARCCRTARSGCATSGVAIHYGAERRRRATASRSTAAASPHVTTCPICAA